MDPMIGGLLLALLCLMIMNVGVVVLLAKFYRKELPDTAIIRSGQGGLKAVVGSGLFVIPRLHKAVRMSLAPVRVELTGTVLDSEAARTRLLPSIFQIAVGRDEAMILLAAQSLGATRPAEEAIAFFQDIILDQFERLLAQENEDPQQNSPANHFIEGVEQALNASGFTIVACRCG